MSKFYSINIQSDFVNILYVEKKKAQYTILEYNTLDIEDFSNFLKDKKNFYISININEVLDDVITLPSSIKKDSIIRGLINKKFQNTLSNKNILLNYKKIYQNIDDHTITYTIDAIPEVNYVKELNHINNYLDIKRTTINKFSLLGLTRKCYNAPDGFGYFSVYTQGKSVIVLAIDEHKNLLFKRNTTAMYNTPEALQATMVEEINQTIAYVKQQFRSAKFSTILLSGSMTLDDIIADNLLLSTNLPVAVLYPNNFIKGLEQEEAQHYIMSLGAMFIKKDEQFLPHKILNLREYNLALLLLMFISFSMLLVTSTIAYQQYSAYSNDLVHYNKIKNRLVQIVRRTDICSQDTLEKSYKHLQISEKFLQHSPSDYLITLRPLLDILHPKQYTFNNQKSARTTISMIFEKQFKTLDGLYHFEKLFLDKFTLLNKEKKLRYINKTDYVKLNFKATIKNVIQNRNNFTSPPERRI